MVFGVGPVAELLTLVITHRFSNVEATVGFSEMSAAAAAATAFSYRRFSTFVFLRIEMFKLESATVNR